MVTVMLLQFFLSSFLESKIAFLVLLTTWKGIYDIKQAEPGLQTNQSSPFAQQA